MCHGFLCESMHLDDGDISSSAFLSLGVRGSICLKKSVQSRQHVLCVHARHVLCVLPHVLCLCVQHSKRNSLRMSALF